MFASDKCEFFYRFLVSSPRTSSNVIPYNRYLLKAESTLQKKQSPVPDIEEVCSQVSFEMNSIFTLEHIKPGFQLHHANFPTFISVFFSLFGHE
ncbi:hypothetical protein CDAR_49261 [Caerostris darwini]|uniref:Uncharacterized protein n=1 Tax=Caerostris darwini TaxID=1538125 RepID=A0AAV4Q925_9ARAC|nr:hypothetical protein CDAR_49261 [Caerostris darwini]